MPSNAALVYAEPPVDVPQPGKHLKRVVDDSFDPDTVPLNGGILIRTKALSLDPYMRGRMRDPNVKSYNQAFALGKPLDTLAVGIVERSEDASVPVGSTYRGRFDAAEWAVVPGDKVKEGKVLENKEGLPFTTLVGAAGMPGATAWVGFYEIGKARERKGQTIFVSAASGAVGQIVVQLAKREGFKVIGSAGSEEKVEFIKSLGVDVAFNYKTESTFDILSQHPPDVYFDNVGGETLDATLACLNNKGVVIACGSVSQYNKKKEDHYGLKNTWMVVTKTLRWEGFIVFQHDLSEFERVFPQLIKSGEVKVKEHVTKGIDNGEAFVDMLAGRNHGKAVISLE